ncbi:hypothetical protein A3765_13560 [Oleiphilus sp. HI0130]|nr:hypothetical protein A3765_13560 [Oleiphilus sp. HI0130]
MDTDITLICRESLSREFDSLRGANVELFDGSGILSVARSIAKVLKANNINHLHVAANPTLLSFSLGALGRLYGIVMTVSSVDSSKLSSNDFSLLSRFAHQGTYFFARKIDFLSSAIRVTHSKLFRFDTNKAAVAPCSFLASANRHSHRTNKEYDLCFVSRLVPLKGVEQLVLALSIIKRPLVVRVCGEGELEKEFVKNEKAIAHHKLVLGYASDPASDLSQSKIFLSLQKYNNYPSQSLLEAMACGCAVIASDVGETRMIVNEKNGKLVNSTEELVKAIEELLSDVALREQLTAESQSTIECIHTLENFMSYFCSRVLGL